MRLLLFTAATLGALAAAGGAWGALASRAELPGCAAAAAYSRAEHGVSFIVVKRGRVVCEDYAPFHGPWRPEQVASGVKGLSALLAAAAAQDGLLTLQEPVAATITEWRDDPAKSRITIGQLLSLSSGVALQSPRPTIREIIDAPLAAPPGAQHIYGNAPFDLFGEVLRRKLAQAGDESVAAYFHRRIGGPLGAPVRFIPRPDGAKVELGAGALITARDWAKLGDLIRLGGVHDGERLVDPGALREALHWRGANPAYAGGWWRGGSINSNRPNADLWENRGVVPADTLVAVGFGKQRLYVSPSEDLVIVRQARGEPRPASMAQEGFSDVQFWRLLRGG
jgi:CubicO group peptidase (beta-lactamase class C family)